MSLSQGGGVGFSLSQPTPQPDGIYSTPIDSLPQNITQKITSQMPPHRVLGTKPLRSSNNKGNCKFDLYCIMYGLIGYIMYGFISYIMYALIGYINYVCTYQLCLK